MSLPLSLGERLSIHQELLAVFPALTLDNYDLESWPTPSYNCVAMAADDPVRRWWPADPQDPIARDFYWPDGVPREETAECFVLAFMKLGYEVCDSDSYESGLEKVVIYENDAGEPQHMARQLGPDLWCSKLGSAWDIYHNAPEILHGEQYGHVVKVMRRPGPL